MAESARKQKKAVIVASSEAEPATEQADAAGASVAGNAAGRRESEAKSEAGGGNESVEQQPLSDRGSETGLGKPDTEVDGERSPAIVAHAAECVAVAAEGAAATASVVDDNGNDESNDTGSEVGVGTTRRPVGVAATARDVVSVASDDGAVRSPGVPGIELAKSSFKVRGTPNRCSCNPAPFSIARCGSLSIRILTLLPSVQPPPLTA